MSQGPLERLDVLKCAGCGERAFLVLGDDVVECANCGERQPLYRVGLVEQQFRHDTRRWEWSDLPLWRRTARQKRVAAAMNRLRGGG